MRKSTSLIALSTLAILSACSTVPKMNALTEGLDKDQLGTQKQMRVSNDPVCIEFYENVIAAAEKSAKAKRTNAQMASAGVSVASVVAGLGPLGSIATQSAARVLINRAASDVSSTEFDPENKFDARIIEAANEVNCPVKVKGATTKP